MINDGDDFREDDLLIVIIQDGVYMHMYKLVMNIVYGNW